MEDISEIHLKGKHVIVKTKPELKLDTIDSIFYCNFGFGCDPEASGTKIFGQFMTTPEDTYIRRSSVIRLATEDEIRKANERLREKIIDEICTCKHLKSQHAGLNGHGSCNECDCKQFTWEKWVLKS